MEEPLRWVTLVWGTSDVGAPWGILAWSTSEGGYI